MRSNQQYFFLKQSNFFVTPSGFEPESPEPESDILSIELWDHLKRKNSKKQKTHSIKLWVLFLKNLRVY